MSDTQAMQAQLMSEIAAAADAGTLEALRVAALGKSGSITALLKTLGGMTPEERQSEGPRIHALREAVTEAIADTQGGARSAPRSTQRLATEATRHDAARRCRAAGQRSTRSAR